jgi:hypothetical protein
VHACLRACKMMAWDISSMSHPPHFTVTDFIIFEHCFQAHVILMKLIKFFCMICSCCPKPSFDADIIKWRVSCCWFIHEHFWQAWDLNLEWLYAVKPQFYIFVGAVKDRHKIQWSVKFGEHGSYRHLARAIQRVHKVTEKAECSNVNSTFNCNHCCKVLLVCVLIYCLMMAY